MLIACFVTADNNHSEIYWRSYQDGTSVYEKKLSPGGTSGTNWKHISPDVSIDDRGYAVVVWADDPDGNGVFNIAYRVVSPTGTVVASGHANKSTTGNQIVPKVAADPDGAPGSTTSAAFTVVWEDIQGSATTVRAAGFTTNTTRAYEVRASQSAGNHHRPDVAVSAAGDATIVWEQDADNNTYADIGLTRLAKSTGAVQIAPRLANVNTAGQQRRPAIAENYTGDTVLAWESDHTGTKGVWTRAFTSTVAARYTETQASSGAGAGKPTAGLDDQANSLIGWTVSGVDGWVRGFNPDGTGTGRLTAQKLTQVSTGRQDELKVAVSPWNEVAVSYTDDNDGNGWDQVMLGVGATNGSALEALRAKIARELAS